MPKYGLINKVDAKLLENAIDESCEKFTDEVISITEVGLYGGETGNGLREYVASKNRALRLTGIDNNKDKEPLRFSYDELIIGSSIEVYNQLPDKSQNLILIDGNHSFPYVVADTYCYMPKVKIGGFIAFHDAAPHSQWVSYQRMGDPNDPDMSIAVLKALEKIGLLGENHNREYLGFELVAHEWDVEDEGGGTAIFRRIK